jgi:hypothetical protein
MHFYDELFKMVTSNLGVIQGGLLVLMLTIARHLLAPKKDSQYYRVIFDVIQDLAKNNDRIGEVRNDPATIAVRPPVVAPVEPVVKKVNKKKPTV